MHATDIAIRQSMLAMLPDQQVREVCLRQFLKSIIFADAQGPSKWGVYFKADRDKVRLLVGNIIVATLCPNGLWMTLDETALTKADSKSYALLERTPNWKWDPGEYGRYKAVPSRNGYFLPTVAAPDVTPLVEGSHHEYIRQVGRKYAALNVRSQRLHDDSVLRLLAYELNEFVPRPEYEPLDPIDPAPEPIHIHDSSIATECPDTEREAIRLSRVGQGRFRRHVKQYWSCCSVTGCEVISLLRASHIKPWRHSDDRERLDVFNGFLLIPNLDAAFDEGIISFTDEGEILISSAISPEDAQKLGILQDMKIRGLDRRHRAYLEYHRTKIFRKHSV